MFDELYGQAEHDDFEYGREDMERRAYRLAAEQDADLEALYDYELNTDAPTMGVN